MEESQGSSEYDTVQAGMELARVIRKGNIIEQVPISVIPGAKNWILKLSKIMK